MKSYFDSLTGFVEPTGAERGVIDSATFRRLQGVRQMGALYLVFPGATHTRFAHSLGAMKHASMYCDHLEKRLKERGEDLEGAKDLVRASALLHDIGHAPFSHNVEAILEEEYQAVETTLATGGVSVTGEDHKAFQDHQLFDGLPIKKSAPYTHETIGHAIILNDKGIRMALDTELEGGAEAVVDLLEDESGAAHAWQKAIVDGGLDADKMDYIQRDCRALGIGLGALDVDQILKHLDIHAGSLVLEEDAFTGYQHMMLARYLLYSGFVANHHVHCLEETITRCYRHLVNLRLDEKSTETVLPGLENYLDMVHEATQGNPDPVGGCTFTRFTDSYLISRLHRARDCINDLCPSSGSPLDGAFGAKEREALKVLLDAVIQGKPFATVARVDTIELRGRGQQDNKMVEAFSEFEAKIRDDFVEDLALGRILIKTLNREVFKDESREFEIHHGPTEVGHLHSMTTHPLSLVTGFHVAKKEGNDEEPSAHMFTGRRVFAHPDLVDQLQEKWKQIATR